MYPQKPPHLELDAREILRLKHSWEAFVAEANTPSPRVLATLTTYGTEQLVHSLQLAMQWPDSRIEYVKSFHLLDGDFDRLTDQVIQEVAAIGPRIKLALIDQPVSVEHCPCCHTGLSHTLQPAVVTRLTGPRWAENSLCSIYVNPDQPSLAIALSLGSQRILSANLHLCKGKFLHYSSDGIDESTPILAQPSVHAQASHIVNHFLRTWQPGSVFIGTGNPDQPELVEELILPKCWESRHRRRS